MCTQKNQGTTYTLVMIIYECQSALDEGSEARLVQVVFSAAFDHVNHNGLLLALCSIGCPVLCSEPVFEGLH